MSSASAGDETAGFNTEISYRHFKFHVQTENMGEPGSPAVNTLIFLAGALVHKLSTQFDVPSDPEEQRELVCRRVREQHLAILVRVERGEFAPERST